MGDLDDRAVAAIELIGRTGARDVEIGFLHDDVPSDQADWWASANYRGAKVHVEHKRSPGHALDSLLARLLDGATCRWCGRQVTNRKTGNGPRYCRYVLQGDRYVRGCQTTHQETTVPVPAWIKGGSDG